MDNNNYRLRKAKEEVKKLKDFYIHIIVTIIAIPIVVFINLTFSPEFHWFWIAIWAFLFSLVMHWISNFKLGNKWEDQKIKELMQKHKR